MSSEEKSAWIMGVVAIGGYGTYLAIILSMAAGSPLADVNYVAPLLWTVGAGIVANIVLRIVSGVGSPKEKKDTRDREIYRFGESIGSAFVVIGALSAMLMALAKWDGFWIANVVYLCFVLSAVVSSVARVIAYRRGFAW